VEERIKLIVDSFGIDYLLEKHEVPPELVLTWLLDEGYLKLEEYFDELQE